MPNFNSENPGTWFYFDASNESLGGVCLRELSTEEHDRIERITVRVKRKFKRGTWYEDREENKQLTRKLQWDFCIVDWKNVQLDGVELECNAENKVKMMNITNFVKFIAESLEELTETNESLEQAKLKNSVSSSSGKLENQTAVSAQNFMKKEI